MADNDDDDLLPTKGNCKPQPGHVAHAVGGAFGTEVVGDVEGGGIYRCTLQYAATLERAAQKLEDHLQKTLHGKGAGCPLGPACGIAVKRGKGRQEPGYIGYSTGDGLGRRKSCRAVRHVSGSIAIVYGRSRFFPTYTSQRPPSPATDAAPMPLHRRAQTSQQWLWARGTGSTAYDAKIPLAGGDDITLYQLVARHATGGSVEAKNKKKSSPSTG